MNQAQLDDGTCGHHLQIGSDPTASSSATPWFLLYGDGTRASYNISIDGAPIGTFTVQDLFGDVCVHSTLPLSEGTHRLTGNEISPNSAGTVTPFNFSVDTVAPPAPSTPVIASFSDSGIKGDNTTMFPNPTLTGTTVPGLGVVLYDNGAAGIGGASSDSTGLWSARTTNLPDGIHPITTATVDTAGNKSTVSGSLPLRIDTTPPTGVLTNPTSGSTRQRQRQPHSRGKRRGRRLEGRLPGRRDRHGNSHDRSVLVRLELGERRQRRTHGCGGHDGQRRERGHLFGVRHRCERRCGDRSRRALVGLGGRGEWFGDAFVVGAGVEWWLGDHGLPDLSVDGEWW